MNQQGGDSIKSDLNNNNNNNYSNKVNLGINTPQNTDKKRQIEVISGAVGHRSNQ